MTLFWILSAVMIIAAIALLAPTMLRKHRASEDASEEFNIEIAREHLSELEKQKATGDFSDEEFAQARKDIEVALAEDLEGTTNASPAARSGGQWGLIVAAILIVAITVPVYFEIGSPELIKLGPQQAQATPGHGGGELPPISELAQQLRDRMEANPENTEGWFLLGRTYMRMNDYNGAVYAFEKVVERLPNETAALLSLADALAMQNGREVPARAEELLRKVLTMEPESVTALWLLGNAAADKGETATALSFWNKAYPLLAEDPGMQAELGQMIMAAGGKLPASRAQLPPIMAPTPPPAAPATVNEAPAPASTASTEVPSDGGAAITVEVALAPHLMETTAPTDTLFVLARAESGPPMPLAVSRHRVDELPLRVTLTDAMAMMPAMRLSSFPKVKVSAKVSKSGQAGTQRGDLLAGDVVVDSANAPDSVQLLINQVAQ